MKKVSRRTFFTSSLGAAAALSLPAQMSAETVVHSSQNPQPADEVPDIIDTNVHLFDWPFRKLKYGETKALVAKLRKHRVSQAWAGSYEALFHKDINGVNARLAEECRVNGEGMLLPFGAVNLAWPDWEEDLRRCHEVHEMRGIRIHPIYQTFDLDHPDFPELVEQVARRKMILQIVGDMEDIRHHHPIVEVRGVNMERLVDVMKQVPDARIQLVYWNHRVPRNLLSKLVEETKVVFDISRLEGAGEVGRLIEGNPWTGKAAPIPVSRFLFGSHAPYFPVETNVIKLFESPLRLEQMHAIMNGNARQLLQAV
jgi:hypothetical protein